MAHYLELPLAEIEKDILADGIIDAKEASALRARLFADGKIDREEAEFLFRLNDAVSGKTNAPEWRELFVQALTQHVLANDISREVLDEAEWAWLKDKIDHDGNVDACERDLLVSIVAKAKSAPEAFQDYVLATLKASILEDGVIDEAEVGMIRTVIYGAGSGGGAAIDRKEADFLFELNDAVTDKSNHPSWQDLFIEAIGKHVLEDESSPGVVDEDEAVWLISNIWGDGKVDEIEKALCMHIKVNAKGMPANLADMIAKLG
jgi:uncharacterized membrane protein YebE (DUF533 family)